ncbi:MAG: RNA polymerase sigma factor [Limisphaerales bacterium]
MSDFPSVGYYLGEMQPKSDAQLLRDYAEHGEDAAFTALVQRYTSLVYSAALRQVESPDIAAEISQNVFVGLARGARTLAPGLAAEASLAGWLCRCTRNLSLNHRRDEFRRQTRERQAMEQFTSTPDDAPDWSRLHRVLDDAMSELAEADYDALVLRYYQNQDLKTVGAALGTSDDTAQKRVSRALDKLRDLLAQRGIRTTAGALSVTIAANSVQAAPLGLAAKISAAALTGTAATTATIIATTKTIAMTTFQKIAVTAALAATIGAGIYEAKQAHDARNETARLQAQQAPMQEQIRQLQNSFAESTNRLGDLLAENAQLKSNPHEAELLKLRGQVGVLQAKANQSQKLSDSILGSANGMGEMLKSSVTASLDKVYAKLFTDLNLTPEQVSNLKQLIIDKKFAGTTEKAALFAGKMTPDQAQQLNDQIDKEKTGFDEQIKQMLGSDGFATYQAYEKTYNERSQIVGPMGFSDHLTDGTELNSSQTEQLVQAMADERRQFKFTVDLSNPGKFGGATATMYSDANVNQYLAEMEQLNQLYLARAQTILTPDQQTIFQKFLSNQIANQKMVLNMTAKIIGARSGKNN